jgi:hypothetical protein
MKCYRASTIFVCNKGLINVNISSDGFAYDAQGNIFQRQGIKWVLIGTAKKDPILAQSAGCAPMNGKHSVLLKG